jgi:hypothetical protein
VIGGKSHTDTIVKQVEHTRKPNDDKYADGLVMYLLDKSTGKFWRSDYTHNVNRQMLALGVCHEESLAGFHP